MQHQNRTIKLQLNFSNTENEGAGLTVHLQEVSSTFTKILVCLGPSKLPETGSHLGPQFMHWDKLFDVKFLAKRQGVFGPENKTFDFNMVQS